MSISLTFMAECAKNQVVCVIQGTVQCLPRKKLGVHSNAPTTVPRPTSKQENLNIQPSKKTWKMENDGSLTPHLLDKGAHWTRGRGVSGVSLRVTWQGAFRADRARGPAADLGDVCSVVAWRCLTRPRGCCWGEGWSVLIDCPRHRRFQLLVQYPNPCWSWQGAGIGEYVAPRTTSTWGQANTNEIRSQFWNQKLKNCPEITHDQKGIEEGVQFKEL